MRKRIAYTLGFILIGCYQSTPIELELEVEEEVGAGGDAAVEGDAGFDRRPGSLHTSPNPHLVQVAEAAMKVYLLWQEARCTCHHGAGECPWKLAKTVNAEATQCLADASRGDDAFYRWLYDVGDIAPGYLACTERYRICPGSTSSGRCESHGEFAFHRLFGSSSDFDAFIDEYNRCVREELELYR